MSARYCFAAIIALSAALVAMPLFAAEPTPADDGAAATEELPAPQADKPASTKETDSAKTAASAKEADNKWRYRFYNGHWWYWQPDKHWVFWTGNEWQDYDRQSYSQWLFERQMARYEAEGARVRAAPYPGGYPLYFGTYGGYFGPGPYGPGSFYWRGSFPGPFPGSLWQGNLNIGTSVGGYMGGALRGPAGY